MTMDKAVPAAGNMYGCLDEVEHMPPFEISTVNNIRQWKEGSAVIVTEEAGILFVPDDIMRALHVLASDTPPPATGEFKGAHGLAAAKAFVDPAEHEPSHWGEPNQEAMDEAVLTIGIMPEYLKPMVKAKHMKLLVLTNMCILREWTMGSAALMTDQGILRVSEDAMRVVHRLLNILLGPKFNSPTSLSDHDFEIVARYLNLAIKLI